MKKNTVISAVLFAASYVSAFAEELTVRAHIPFAFTVSGKAMLAGDYVLAPVTGFTSVLKISGTTPGSSALILAQSLGTESSSAALIFATTNELPMLTVVQAPGKTFELSHAASRPGSSFASVTFPVVTALRRK